MGDIATSLKDFLFPARVPLRDAAATGDVKPDAASQAATARAAANPSGIDVAAEAAKRAPKPVAAAPAPAAAPIPKKKLGTAGKIGAQFMEQ